MNGGPLRRISKDPTIPTHIGNDDRMQAGQRAQEA